MWIWLRQRGIGRNGWGHKETVITSYGTQYWRALPRQVLQHRGIGNKHWGDAAHHTGALSNWQFLVLWCNASKTVDELQTQRRGLQLELAKRPLGRLRYVCPMLANTKYVGPFLEVYSSEGYKTAPREKLNGLGLNLKKWQTWCFNQEKRSDICRLIVTGDNLSGYDDDNRDRKPDILKLRRPSRSSGVGSDSTQWTIKNWQESLGSSSIPIHMVKQR